MEAQYYQIKYAGHIFKLTNEKGGKHKTMYLLMNNVKKELEESFNTNKDLIHDIQLFAHQRRQ